MAERNIIFRIFSGFWRALDEARRFTVNIIFLLLMIVIISSMLKSDTPEFPDSAALVINIRGNLVEQLSGEALDRAIAEATGDEQPQTLLRDVVDAIGAGKDDKRIKLLLLDLDGMQGAGLPNMQAVAQAIADFKSSGKKVIATGSNYIQNQYFLAAMADEVYLHPFGAVYIEGYSRFRMFYKDAIDKLKIDWNIFRVGEFKSFVEPYTRSTMSDEDRASSSVWLNALWTEWQADVTAARELPADGISRYVENLAMGLRAAEGDTARLALEAGLVDELLSHEVVRERLTGLVGEDKKTHSYNAVNFKEYVDSGRARLKRYKAATSEVAVIMAVGSITTGDQPPGTIGSESLSRLLIKAREDPKIKAVVLRVDSGGGSMYASEVILREVQLLKSAGKPVIASMGSVAASGGYYISMAADEIFASPGTLTGSVGVLGMFPTFQRSLASLGLNVDGVGTTSLSGGIRLDRALGEPAREALQLSVENSYRTFISRVAQARNTSIDEIDKIARGRVWVGRDALEIGLVDKLGGLEDAVAAAAEKAGLGEKYKLRYMEKELGFRERLLLSMLGGSVRLQWQRGPVSELLNGLDAQLQAFARISDPANHYALCFCEVR